MTIRLTTEAPAATRHSNPQRNLLVRAVDTRWFALADFAIVSISVALLIAQALDPGQLQFGGWPLILAFIPWGIRLAVGRFPFQRTRLDLFIALFLLAAALGVWTAYDQDFAWVNFWLIVGGIMIFYALAGQPPANHWLLAGLLGLLGMLMASYFLLTHDWRLQPAKIEIANNIGLWWMSVRPSLVAPAINPNAAASFTAMMTPFIVAFGIRGWRNRQTPYVVAVAALGALNLMALFLTASRGAWVALAAGMGAWILWSLSGHAAQLINWHRSKLFALVILFMPAIFMWLASVFPGGPIELANSLPGPASAERRLELAGETLALIADFPFTGGGLGSFPGLYSRYMLAVPVFAVAHGHNLYLDFTLETSLLGLFALLALLLGSGWLLIRRLRQSEIPNADDDLLRWAALAALVVVSVHGLVDYNYQGAPFLFFLVGMAIALTHPSPMQNSGRGQPVGRDFLPILSVLKNPWKTAGVVTVLIAAIVLAYSFRKPLLARWYANIGALSMARVELAGWPNAVRDGEETLTALRPAEVLFTEALALSPNNRTANHRLGLIRFRQLNFISAVRYLEQAYQQDDTHRGIWRSLGSSYIWAGEFDRVTALDEELSLDGSEVRSGALAAWHYATRGPSDWLWLVYEAMRAGNNGVATYLMELQSIGSRALSQAITESTRKTSKEFFASIQAWVGAGDIMSLRNAAQQATEDGRLDDLLLAYHALRVIDGENAVSTLALFLRDEKNDLDSAEAVLRQALEEYPNSELSWTWLLNLGNFMRAQNRWEEAQTAYLEALKKDPENLSARIGLGWANYENGDGLEAAIAEFQQVIELYPDRASGYLALGEALKRENRYHEASTWIEQALEADPDCPWCYIFQGQISVGVGELPLALEIYREMLSRFPDFAPGHFEIAWAYRLNEQPHHAVESIEQAMVLDSNPEPWLIVRAAEIYEWVGDSEQARSLYRDALEISPDNEAARKGLGRLEEMSE